MTRSINYIDPTGHSPELLDWILQRILELFVPKIGEAADELSGANGQLDMTTTLIICDGFSAVNAEELMHADDVAFAQKFNGVLTAVELYTSLDKAMENALYAKQNLVTNIINVGAQQYNLNGKNGKARDWFIAYPTQEYVNDVFDEGFVDRSFDTNFLLSDLGYDWYDRSKYWDEYTTSQQEILTNDVFAYGANNIDEYNKVIAPFGKVSYDMFFIIY